MMLKKLIQILLVGVGSLILILAILVFIIARGYLNDFIVAQISKQGSAPLNGELKIGSMTGNVFTSFILHDINIISDSDTILSCDEIGIDFYPRGLLKNVVEINTFTISGLDLDIRQEQDSSWNFMNLLKSSPGKDTIQADFNWNIIVHDLIIDRFNSDLSMLEEKSFIPGSIDTRLNLSASFSGDSLVVNLRELYIVTENPGLGIINLSGRIIKRDSIVDWHELRLKFNNTLAVSHGSLELNDRMAVNAILDFSPLAFEDIRAVFPGITISGNPEISGSIKGDIEKYDVGVKISEQNQTVDLSGIMLNIQKDPEYSVNINFKNVDGSYWTANDKLKSDISGIIDLKGKGLDFRNNSVYYKGRLSEIKYSTYSAGYLELSGSKESDHVHGSFKSQTFAGYIDMKYDIDKIFSFPAYDIVSSYRNVNLSSLTGIDSLVTSLNGDLSIKGSGTSRETLSAELVLNSVHSMVMSSQVDAFTMRADYNRGIYNFLVEEISTPFFLFGAEGHGDMKENNEISFTFHPLEPGTLLSMFNLPRVETSGTISGNLSGSTDSLTAIVRLDLADIFYDSITIKELDAKINIALIDSLYNGVFDINSAGITFKNKFPVRSANLSGEFSPGMVVADIDLTVNDSLSTVFSGRINGFDNPVINVRQLSFDYLGNQWSALNDSTYIVLEDDHVFINRFMLNSGDQNIFAHGRFSPNGQEDLLIEMNNINLSTLPADRFIPYDISGILNSSVRLTGTSDNPVIAGRVLLDGVEINEFEIDSIRSFFDYDNDLISFSGSVNTGMDESLEASMNLPFHISLSDSSYMIKDTSAFSGSVVIDSFDIRKVLILLPEQSTSAKGFISAGITIGNSLKNPVISGDFGISGGAVENTEYGIDYEDIRVKGRLEKKRLELVEFNASTKKGKLSIQGFININSTDSMALNELAMTLKASDFQALESDLIELNMNSDLKLTGNLEVPVFGGKVEINSSKLNVDYLRAELALKTEDPDPPLLLQAMGDTLEAELTRDTTRKLAFSGTDFYKNLRGEVQVDIPGNTWVSGRDMNLEIQGTLRSLKSSENIELFGNLSVRRGTYRIYGRSFDFTRGEITFTGGSGFNPNVDLEIIYKFRDVEKEMRDLEIAVKGSLQKPELTFRLDDQVIEEKDALSYIVFGKSINQLGTGERDKISGSDIALSAAFSGLSTVLEGILKETTGVDVFEVSGGEDWKSGSVTIGKYITNKLYLSYDRSFDFNSQSRNANTEKIMLEYQLFRNFILKATNQDINSGFDLIFKKRWR